MKKLTAVALLACIQLLACSYLAAQDDPPPDYAPPPDTPDDSPATPPTSPDNQQAGDKIVIINYAPDEAPSPDNSITGESEEKGKANKLPGLEPDQEVKVSVQYGAAKAGHLIEASPLNGGQITTAEEELVVDDQGALNLVFQAGHDPGFYPNRVTRRRRGDGVHFWVLNNENPDSNPRVDLPAPEPGPED